jgi:Calpain family cysteine protease
MPISPAAQKLQNRISAALANSQVSNTEMTSILANAKTVGTEATPLLQKFVERHQSKFESAAKAQIDAFLKPSAPAPVVTTPSLPTPPAPAVITVSPPPATQTASVSTTRDLADPAVLTKHNTSVSWNPVSPTGKLFVDSVNYDDVTQGSIGNCYMVAAFSAVAKANPKAIEDAIKDNKDGTFTVRFFEAGKEVKVDVDGDVPSSMAGGTSRYGKARDTNEMWVTVLEKAFAQWKGGYEAIGNGGSPSAVMQAITGKSTGAYSVANSPDATIFRMLQEGVKQSKPMAAVTFGEDQNALYTGTGVHAWHAYTILNVSEENGQKFVELRNPWGRGEAGSDGKDDGAFKLKFEDFKKLYMNFYV